jgi:hypothetical protein
LTNSDGSIIIECVRIGGALKVSAVDVGDGTEVCFTAPVDVLRADLEKVARQKLEYCKKRRLSPTDSSGPGWA